MCWRSICTEWRAGAVALLSLLAVFSGMARGQSIEKALMPGELIRGHAKYEHECGNCHRKFDRGAQSRLCADCHKEVGRDLAAGTGYHGRTKDKPCSHCHTEHKGRQADIAAFDKQAFAHDRTDFRLSGAHLKIGAKCESCHRAEAKFRDAPGRCNDCHGEDDRKKGHQGRLGSKCESCHGDTSWKETRFDHERTRFPLLGGKHAEVKCAACHEDKTYAGASLTCNGCHNKDDRKKGHQGRFGTKCESCHSDRGWKDIAFNHDRDTKYPLRGKHEAANCDACHRPELGALATARLGTRCIACHRGDDQKKGHQGALGEKCESCHNERGWKESNFNHDDTDFPLRDKHRTAKCDACHDGGVSGRAATIKLKTECVACHRKDDRDKGHKGRYGDKCESCHTARGWKDIHFNHDRDTKYRLKDKHREVKCDACHLPEQGPIHGIRLASDCHACHKGDDKHEGQLGTRCEECHNEKRWTGVPYDHNKARFALTGSHAKVECKACHKTAAFRKVPTTCHGCHRDDDAHKGRFGRKCEQCHYTGTWKSWDFDHGKTDFPLDGKHRDVPCDACHKTALDGPAAPTRRCVSCHIKDDVHNGGFGSQCERCHRTTTWRKTWR